MQAPASFSLTRVKEQIQKMINYAHGAGGEADVEAEELGEKHPVARRAVRSCPTKFVIRVSFFGQYHTQHHCE